MIDQVNLPCVYTYTQTHTDINTVGVPNILVFFSSSRSDWVGRNIQLQYTPKEYAYIYINLNV